LPANQRVKQFLVFFTAGKADSFRDIFTQDNNDYDAVIPDPDDVGWLVVGCLRDPYDGTSMGVDFKPTGDGKPEAVSACGNTTTEWHVFEDYPIAGYSSPYCDISDSPLRGYVLDTAKKMTIYHAGKLKEQGIIIYCIGLGIVDGTFLKEDISSWDPAHPEEEYYFKAPSSSEMKRIFNQVAMEIKKYVYLVQ
ncbi:MAG: hypothetical protein U9N58_02450, partial [Thermodesulfobacteriota bacterium]|nr:hypothetical protein [Thermodesulfobacteriota bacterium]